MTAFLEDRLPVCVRLGASWGEDFAVDITQTASGSEYRRLIHPYPVLRGSIKYTRDISDMWDEILSLYRRVYGRYAGFRVKAMDNCSTNKGIATPTSADQLLDTIVAGASYQLVAKYGSDGVEAPVLLSIGEPKRIIKKPVAGTVKISIFNLSGSFETTDFSVDTTNGVVTIGPNRTRNITSITKGATTVVNFSASHTFQVGESIHISGVVGMTEINGKRAKILSKETSQVTLELNSSTFTNYTSGGIVNTRPQQGESVYGGCEFDIPCRFDSSIDLTSIARGIRDTSEISIVEILNP